MAIIEGRLQAEQKLPATRELAKELGVSRNTVLTAYEQLQAEGYIRSKIGSGTFVEQLNVEQIRNGPARAWVPPPSSYARRARRTFDPTPALRRKGLRFDLQCGEPLVDPVLIGAWRRALSRAAAYAETRYPPTQGLTSLREAVSDYLARRRGIRVTADEVHIVSGIQQTLALTARVLLDEGDSAIVEEPHYFAAHQVFKAHGARIKPIPTDGEGLACKSLPARGAKLIYVTPSHQFPGGSVMSLPRRLELLRYAAKKRCWILEDDYDSEFRYDVHPLAALRALDRNDRVIYMGSFSKVLFPALRLAYVIVPKALRKDFIAAKWLADMGSPTVEQLALADLISNGGFERHLRRTVKSLKARREAVLDGLAQHAADFIDTTDSHAGMHVVAWLRDFDWPMVDALIETAQREGVGLYSLAPHYVRRPRRPALLIGYAGLPAADLERAMAILGRCLREVS